MHTEVIDNIQIVRVIEEIVKEFANVECDELNGKNLVEDLGYDSVSLMQLISEMEERLGISMEADMMIESLESFDSLMECVMELMEDEI